MNTNISVGTIVRMFLDLSDMDVDPLPMVAENEDYFVAQLEALEFDCEIIDEFTTWIRTQH